jgi:hypothetical protein
MTRRAIYFADVMMIMIATTDNAQKRTLIQFEIIHLDFFSLLLFRSVGRQQNVKVNCYCVSVEALNVQGDI